MRFFILLLAISTGVYADTSLSVNDIRDIHCAGIDKEIRNRDATWLRYVERKKVVRQQQEAARAEQPRNYDKIKELRTEFLSVRESASEWLNKTRESLIFKYTVCSSK